MTTPMPWPPGPARSDPARPVRVRPDGGMRALPAAVTMIGLLALLWFLEVLDQASGNALDGFGIRSQELDGLPQLFVAPFLHFGFEHLASNSMPFLVLGFLVLLGGMARWLLATLSSVVSSGVVAWALTPAGSIVAGASGVVFGWLAYLVARGIWSRQPAQVVIGIVVLLVYGGLLWGVLPSAPGVSWQAHLGGAVGGLLAARWLHRRQVRRPAVAGYPAG